MDEEPKAATVNKERVNPLKRAWSSITKKKNNNPKDVKPGKTPLKIPNLIKSKRFWLTTTTAVIIVAFGCGGLWWYRSNTAKSTIGKGKTIFIIEGKKYKDTEVRSYADFLTKYLEKEEEAAVKEVFELIKYKTAAEKVGISLSDTRITDARKLLDEQNDVYKDVSEYKRWAELESVRVAVDQSLQSFPEDTAYKGYSFIFWFANRINQTPDYTPPGGNDDQKLLQEDKNYAKQKADYYHDQINNKKMSEDQAIKEIKDDPKLCYQYKVGSNFSVRFGSELSKSWSKQIYYKSVSDYASKNSAIELSDVQVGKTFVKKSVAENSQYEEAETFYYFVKMEGESSISTQKFNQTLEALKTEYIGLT